MTYTTTQGETWDMIAKTVFGDEKQMHALMEANPEHRDTVFFSAGITLTVPGIETTVSDPAPPWKT